MEHDLRTERGDRIGLHSGRGDRHHDRRCAPEPPGAQRYPLRVVACRCADDSTLELLRAQVDHLVVCAAQLEAEDGLIVLALEQHRVVTALRQVDRGLEWSLFGDVVDPRGEDLLPVLGDRQRGWRVSGIRGGHAASYGRRGWNRCGGERIGCACAGSSAPAVAESPDHDVQPAIEAAGDPQAGGEALRHFPRTRRPRSSARCSPSSTRSGPKRTFSARWSTRKVLERAENGFGSGWSVELIALLSNPANSDEWGVLLQETDGTATDADVAKTVRSRQSQRRLERAEVAQLVKAYKSGTRVLDLSAQFEIHRNSVRDVLRRQGVPPRARGLTARQVREAALLYGDGHSVAQLGERFNVHAATVWRALRAEGGVIADEASVWDSQPR